MKLSDFKEIWLADFEFIMDDGDHPKPVCMVAWEVRSGKKLRIWQDELRSLPESPCRSGKDTLFIGYYVSAELGCYLQLGWKFPSCVIDLYPEFKNYTNGKIMFHDNDVSAHSRYSLIGALNYFGHDSIGHTEKERMRDLILSGGPWTEEEKVAILDYCETDVIALEKLIYSMSETFNVDHALLRGEYMKAAAIIERNGIPIDTESFAAISEHWLKIQDQLIREVDEQYGVFEGRTFKTAKWDQWLKNQGIPWPRLDSGKLDLKDQTFKEMAKLFPQINAMRELRRTISMMRLDELPVGKDSRNRCTLSAFGSKTSRNQPSSKRGIFGKAVWLRSLIKPNPGYGIAYIDWKQQEFGIAAKLSADDAMMAAYQSGDPYLEFAKQAGSVPPDATKASHGHIREGFKQCALGVLYGMGPNSLGNRVGGYSKAEELLQLHHRTYPRFWEWSENILNYSYQTLLLYTVFGWNLRVTVETKSETLRNFLMQANGAEMMRLACCFTLQEGVKLLMPVHDALLIEAPVDKLDEAISITQKAMRKASGIVLNGFELDSDVKVIRYPDRYIDPRGEEMWDLVNKIVRELKEKRQ